MDNNKNIFSVLPGLRNYLNESSSLFASLEDREPSSRKECKEIWERIDTTLIHSFVNNLENDINRLMEEEWNTLLSYDDGQICCHVLRMLVCVYLDEGFQQLDEHDQNLLLWVTLLHDIAKIGPPIIITKDPFHPFSSCEKSISIFERLGWFRGGKKTRELILEAHYIQGQLKYMDNSKLKNILTHMYHLCGIKNNLDRDWATYSILTEEIEKERLFKIEVLLLILFHQSFTALDKYPAFTPFNSLEIEKYMSNRLLHLLEIIMRNDSNSYLIPYHNLKRRQMLEVQQKFERFKEILNSF